MPALSSDASSGAVLDALHRLVQSGQFQSAHKLAAEYVLEFEGDPEFDFYYGLSALQTGNFEAALFNFERLSTSYPQVQRYRLELARSYFYLDNLEQAEEEFAEVLASDPPEAVVHNIQEFVARIQHKKQQLQGGWYGSVSLAGGYDSNINSATQADQLHIPFFGLIPLAPTAREQSSAFIQARAVLGYRKPLSRVSSVGSLVLFNQKSNLEQSDFNLSNLLLQADYRYRLGALQLRPSISVNQYWLAGSSFQQDVTLNAEAYWQLTPRYQPFARIGVAHSDNKQNNDFDRYQLQSELGIGVNAGRFSSQLSALSTRDYAKYEVESYMRDNYGVNLSAQYQWQRHEFYSMLLWQKQEYQAPILALGATRDEKFKQGLIGYRYRLPKNLSLYVQVSHIKNESNINLYEYRRTLSEAGITLAF